MPATDPADPAECPLVRHMDRRALRRGHHHRVHLMRRPWSETLLMPYSIRRRSDGQYIIYRTGTGDVVGHSDSRPKAEAFVRARYAGEKPVRKKR